MNTNRIVSNRWDDLVFENRNKDYGAYIIRKSYNTNLSKSVLSSLLFFIFVFAMIKVAALLKPEIKNGIGKIPFTHVLDNDFVIPTPEKHIEKTVQRKAEQSTNLQVRVVNKQVVEKPIVDEPITPAVEGNVNGTNVDVVPSNGIGEGLSAPTETIVVPQIFDHAEVMPEYEGGLQAMYKFISKNIHYPNSARNMGHEGTVYVRFVVNDAGQVVNIEVIKGVSAVLDKEATRVIALMKKWKPGKQHNIPVNVRMVLPIKFKIDE